MRGAYLHTHVLVGQIAELLTELGATVHREHYVRIGETFGYVDIWARLGSYSITCEVELSPDRVHKDITKAVALRSDLLLIAVPSKRVEVAVVKRLGTYPTDSDVLDWLEIWVLPLGPALQRLRERCRLMTGPNVLRTSRPQNEGERP